MHILEPLTLYSTCYVTSVVFIVGRTSSSSTQELLEAEHERFGDIVQADFVDHYNNLTLKSVYTLKYVLMHATEAKFLFKVDDDSFVGTKSLWAHLAKRKEEKRAHYRYGLLSHKCQQTT